MATIDKCSVCRRAGEKLFLKGDKCFSPKCTFNKKPYPPGKVEAERKHRSNLSEFGRQLEEKQKVRNIYGMRERQFSNYVKEAMAKKGGNPAEYLYGRLESRLDNALYRLGFAPSRSFARQLVSHGHITVNGRRVTIPSYEVRKGDVIGVREGSRGKTPFTSVGPKLAKWNPPSWLSLSPATLEGTVTGEPKSDYKDVSFQLAAIIEFYSR